MSLVVLMNAYRFKGIGKRPLNRQKQRAKRFQIRMRHGRHDDH